MPATYRTQSLGYADDQHQHPQSLLLVYHDRKSCFLSLSDVKVYLVLLLGNTLCSLLMT